MPGVVGMMCVRDRDRDRDTERGSQTRQTAAANERASNLAYFYFLIGGKENENRCDLIVHARFILRKGIALGKECAINVWVLRGINALGPSI